MTLDNEIVVINSNEIIHIVRRALSKIDPRLMDHGERVGYIARKICENSVDKSDFDISKLLVLSILHDIGAYKTDEIDNMVEFETESTLDHSLYGYLFLKNTTNLARHAEAILYHHTDYSQLISYKSDFENYAALIHLADRIDILINGDYKDFSVLNSLAGTKFNKRYVEAFFRANADNRLANAITSGTYINEFNNFLAQLSVSSIDVFDYLRLIVYAIDFRSPYTVTHTADTTIISYELGKLLGLCEKDLQKLYTGAFLHDIGKIAMPYSILEKSGSLTNQEYEIMKTHVTEGEQIIRGVVSDDVCGIALRHHEKLDGSGYCLGLTADELTLPQRIVGVADMLSALSQRRSYKEPFPKERIISILVQSKDEGKICPVVVDAVLANYDQIFQVVKASHDPVKTLYSNLIEEFQQIRAGKKAK